MLVRAAEAPRVGQPRLSLRPLSPKAPYQHMKNIWDTK